MKKVAALFLSMILTVSLMTVGANGTAPQEPNPTPAPAATLEPVDPEGLKDPEPPAEPQDDPKDSKDTTGIG